MNLAQVGQGVTLVATVSHRPMDRKRGLGICKGLRDVPEGMKERGHVAKNNSLAPATTNFSMDVKRLLVVRSGFVEPACFNVQIGEIAEDDSLVDSIPYV